MSGPSRTEIVCGWCKSSPATCFFTETVRERARRERSRMGYDFDLRKNGTPHPKPWPMAACDSCCGHCRCGWAMCACEFIHEPVERDMSDIPEELRPQFEAIRQEDIRNKEMVRELGARIGFGATMQYASECWGENLSQDGYPSGGQFVLGPCAAMTVDCESVQHRKGHCEWCCGTRRVTARVAQAISEAEKDLRREAEVEDVLES